MMQVSFTSCYAAEIDVDDADIQSDTFPQAKPQLNDCLYTLTLCA